MTIMMIIWKWWWGLLWQWYNDCGDDDNDFLMIMKVMMMTTSKDLVAPDQVCNPRLSWHGKIPRSRVHRYQIFDIIIILPEECYGDTKDLTTIDSIISKIYSLLLKYGTAPAYFDLKGIGTIIPCCWNMTWNFPNVLH